ncbi:hypothetical protein DSS3P1_30 [Ruegeria phage DSS3-P1]|uniref:hypothetical protein n=1 Tax=Ruegeria phage DSS3-P1 TaxID=1555208 RepID=UPI00051A9CB0|nr:hypothetical protein DSS3P1_30 [Ruegeria phage DSS3-P1]YP_009997168.1 hypothetical protein JT311_gp34 [Ruegeria phage vB_RpoS-V16]YP_009997329.1 hypothetical protein JT313_gp30 [Ruegeria phage vB_RpoS-V11]YP_009997412.1 hypothetical protein JT314_gp31 [Ruegeria phage vB_RpoS-V7]AIT13265.1 hypothetical protein DSS3P1_30 [Ruegeria phage DSS3-P1]AWY08734.1 hypothetical protein vBRpoSV7_31 [Ruegeria phage vB_RpoS-V7]AWY09070.1 hypothetical protein vBRpoSV11_30 [Ruegeria phage vB_RpoS-V11]AWY0
MTRKKNSPLPTEDLNDNAAWPFGDGADEIVIRVCRYEDDLRTPASFQAIVRGQDRTRVWGIGIRRTPVASLAAAIESFFTPNAGDRDNAAISTDELAARNRRTAPPPPPADDPSVDDLLS